MPLTKRAVSPVEVSQHRLPPNIRNNELECVSNGTLANLVRQLSSLSKHAEDIFGELYHEAVKLEHKSNTLMARVDRLAKKVTQLDSNVEEVSLQDLHLRKPFKSSSLLDQQSLSRGTLPTAMGECYTRGDRPPDLDKLNPYRDDEKLGLKFYTDPEYFFDLWRQEMLKDADQGKRIKHPRPRIPGEAQQVRKTKRPRQPTDHRAKYFEKALRTGEIGVVDLPVEYQTPEFLRQQAAANANRYAGQIQPPPGMVRPGRLEVAHPGQLNGQLSSGYGSGSDNTDSLPSAAAPYPAPSATGNNLQHHPRVSMHQAYYQQQYELHQKQQQNYQAGRVVTSQYMAAGYALNPAPQDDGTLTAPGAMSPASSDSSRIARPSQPPPAPPPPGVTASPERQVNGDLRNRMNRMAVNPEVRASPPRPAAQPPPAPSPATNDAVLLSPRGVPYMDRSSPDLPPPPPPLTPDQYSSMTVSITSTVTEKLPSPPPTFGSPSSRAGAAPPPPPPPPPAAAIVSNGFSGDDSTSGEMPPIDEVAEARAMSPTKSGAPRRLDARSDLLKAIRDGIKLKKVDRQEEKERERAAVREGHDVAAILRRRMEDVMGRSDSSEEEEWEPDDWDDD